MSFFQNPVKATFAKPTPARKKWGYALALLAAHMFLASTGAAQEPVFLYTVKPGDELIKMSAESFSSPDGWKEIVTLNKLKNPNAIHPGQILRIPSRLMKLLSVPATLVSTSGDVRMGGQKVTSGTLVSEGSQLHTGKNSSAVMVLADGSKVTLLPNTLAALLTSRSPGSIGDSATSNSTHFFSGLLRLSAGALNMLAAKNVQRNTPLHIETPTSLVGVRGTQFRVAYDDPASQNARTEVLEGKVRADNPVQSSGTDLAEGKGSVFNPAVQAITVVDLPKAPDLSKHPELIFKPQALWLMPANADYTVFRIQIAGDRDFEKIVRDVLVKDAKVDLSDLPNGQWFARVRNVRGDSIEGYDAVMSVQVMMPPQPGQSSRQWAVTDDFLEMTDGQQVLRFGHSGLDGSHTVIASVKRARPPFTRIDKLVFKGDMTNVRLALGVLQPDEPLELSLTVAQQDGARVFPMDYAFTALAADGRAQGLLKRLTNPAGSASDSAAQTPAEKAKWVKAEAAQEAQQRAEELAIARAGSTAQAKTKAKSKQHLPATLQNKPRKNPSQRPTF